MRIRTNREDIEIHPKAIIRLMDLSAKHLGSIVIKGRRYQPTREAWIASVFLFALEKLHNQTWFLRVNPKENAIEDIFASAYIEIPGLPGASDRKTSKLQVFEYTKHNKNTLIEAVQDKLRSDLTNCILICYIKTDYKIVWPSLRAELYSKSPKVREIWILGDTGKRKMVIGQVFSQPSAIFLDLDEAHRDKEERTFISPFPVSKRVAKSKRSPIQPTGKTILLKPEMLLDEEDGREDAI